MNMKFYTSLFCAALCWLMLPVGQAMSEDLSLPYALVGQTLVAGYEVTSSSANYVGEWLVDGEVVSTVAITGTGESRLTVQAPYLGKNITFEIRGADSLGQLQTGARAAVASPVYTTDTSQTASIAGPIAANGPVGSYSALTNSGTSYTLTANEMAYPTYKVAVSKDGVALTDLSGINWKVMGDNADQFTWDSSAGALKFSGCFDENDPTNNVRKVSLIGVTSDYKATLVDMTVNVEKAPMAPEEKNSTISPLLNGGGVATLLHAPSYNPNRTDDWQPTLFAESATGFLFKDIWNAFSGYTVPSGPNDPELGRWERNTLREGTLEIWIHARKNGVGVSGNVQFTVSNAQDIAAGSCTPRTAVISVLIFGSNEEMEAWEAAGR